ncbi:hypothetical protein I5907_04100 [Panacibacter sp. DH6]|uniref:Uncharacterized protein n=1 Tax=Panacibacter microcysteis TaxID=2793269 RepID=A0A931GYD3_9BACT|nr:hypothetical protein [Panacibacter microcysteis]MBG9375402.1 hypothetical protein [Panacibacter microcysteis]
MKKLAAILLLAIFAFNTVGYRLFFNMLESTTDAAFTAQLDHGNYDSKDLVEVKVPINMPYQVATPAFERVDGEINVNGQVYKYVMRKVQADTMTLLCLPHYEKTALQNKATEFAGKVNDLPTNDTNKKAEAFKMLTADFDITENLSLAGLQTSQAVSNLYRNAGLSRTFIPENGQPPEVFC